MVASASLWDARLLGAASRAVVPKARFLRPALAVHYLPIGSPNACPSLVSLKQSVAPASACVSIKPLPLVAIYPSRPLVCHAGLQLAATSGRAGPAKGEASRWAGSELVQQENGMTTKTIDTTTPRPLRAPPARLTEEQASWDVAILRK